VNFIVTSKSKIVQISKHDPNCTTFSFALS